MGLTEKLLGKETVERLRREDELKQREIKEDDIKKVEVPKRQKLIKLYQWQKIALWIIGIFTFIAVTLNTLGKEFNFGYFLDLIIGIGVNILILWLLFQLGNWIYRHHK